MPLTGPGWCPGAMAFLNSPTRALHPLGLAKAVSLPATALLVGKGMKPGLADLRWRRD